MKKSERVKSKELFNYIINNGKKYSSKAYTIFYIESDKDEPLFGISAPKKLGNAVIRNRVKRQTRELIHDTKLLFKKKRNYIIIVKETFKYNSYEDNLKLLKNIIGDINEK